MPDQGPYPMEVLRPSSITLALLAGLFAGPTWALAGANCSQVACTRNEATCARTAVPCSAVLACCNADSVPAPGIAERAIVAPSDAAAALPITVAVVAGRPAADGPKFLYRDTHPLFLWVRALLI